MEQFNDLHLSGEHRTSLDAQNTFKLSEPHTVVWGMGITFLAQVSIGLDTQINPQLIVSSAGGDFFTA